MRGGGRSASMRIAGLHSPDTVFVLDTRIGLEFIEGIRASSLIHAGELPGQRADLSCAVSSLRYFRRPVGRNTTLP